MHKTNEARQTVLSRLQTVLYKNTRYYAFKDLCLRGPNNYAILYFY